MRRVAAALALLASCSDPAAPLTSVTDALGGGDTATLADSVPTPDTRAEDVQALPPDASGPLPDLAQPGDTAESPPDVSDPFDVPVDPDACATPPYGFLCGCAENDDCLSGYCVPTEDPERPMVCTEACVTDCPNDWPCKGVTSGADTVFLCLPEANTLCNACVSDSDCGAKGQRCLEYDDGRFCGRDCATDGCPAGYACASIADGAALSKQCQPVSGSCLCDAEVDYTSDPANCGKCGHVCVFDGGTADCAGSSCVLTGCLDDHYDLDQKPGNGCEYACTPQPGADVPDGQDQNCDGIDGDLTRAWFVAPSGDDGAAGTIDAPLRTVTAAVSRFATTPARDHVYIAAGLYSGQVVLPNGLHLYGGYSPDGSWARNPVAYESALTNTSADPSGHVRAVVVEVAEAGTLDALTITAGAASAPGASSYGLWIREATSGFVVRGCRIAAGAGAPGSDGVGGDPGKDGAVGQPGGSTTDTDCNCNEFDVYGGKGGAGGTAQCSGGYGAGGAGASGACDDTNGSAGDAAPEGTPGGPYGSPGGDGAPGAPGEHGKGGEGGDVSPESGLWRGTAGGDGTAGGPGKGGGGGSSGKGADGGTFGCASWGGGGGGGGSAGCGGERGLGARAGGGSFAVFLVDADPTLEGNVFVRGPGGKGGKGGTGGTRGAGKAGGDPGTGNADAGDGQKGGKGGDGGDGGNGGGGAGGPSYGLFTGPKASPSCLANTFESTGTGGDGGGPATGPGVSGGSGDKNKPTVNCL